MRKVTYGAACSLDGFITGPDGSLDWLHMSRDVHTIMAEYWSRVDTVLMGRKTWEVAQAMGGGGGGGDGDGGPMSGISTYVFSRTLDRLPAAGAELVKGDAGGFMRQLKRRNGKEICVLGGGDLARSLFEEGVIDEVGLNIHPVLLGTGIPFFLNAGRIKLDLIENRTIGGGCVYVLYKVRARRKAVPTDQGRGMGISTSVMR
jgi:dihydrofolate reductase